MLSPLNNTNNTLNFELNNFKDNLLSFNRSIHEKVNHSKAITPNKNRKENKKDNTKDNTTYTHDQDQEDGIESTIRSTSSQAVIHALRTLQLKIRSLESERDELIDQLENMQSYEKDQIISNNSEINKLKENLNISNNEISILNSKILSLQDTIKNKDNILESKNIDNNNLYTKYDELHKLILSKQEEFSKNTYQLNKKINELQDQRDQYKLEYEESLKMVNIERKSREAAEAAKDQIETHLTSVLSIQESLVNEKIKKVRKKEKADKNEEVQKFTKKIEKSIRKEKNERINIENQYNDVKKSIKFPFMPPSVNSHNINSTISEIQAQTPIKTYSSDKPSHVHPHSRIVNQQALDEISKVISSLELEIDDLQTEYTRIINTGDFNNLITKNGDEVILSSEIRNLVDLLEKKGEQLFTLKRYYEDIKSGHIYLDSINSLNSNECKRNYENKIKSLKLLNELKKLKK